MPVYLRRKNENSAQILSKIKKNEGKMIFLCRIVEKSKTLFYYCVSIKGQIRLPFNIVALL
ncbi:MAG: hypothetical protein EBX41_09960 [Chitinophagia bacterium]|nr:hypothetical protein [Chitinophagia bacterium]